jgi:hypothetical protein
MFVKALHRFAFFLLACVCFGGAAVKAQSPAFDTCCAGPGVFCDALQKAPMGSDRAKNYVDSVTFDAPVSLTSAELQPAITLLKDSLFERDPEWLGKVQDALREPWRDQGYFSVEVTVRAVPVGGDDGRYAITAHVDEGLQYRLGHIDFRAVPGTHFETMETWKDGPVLHRRAESVPNDTVPVDPYRPVFPVEELRAAIPMQDGDIFSARDIRYGLEALHKLYGQQGYIDMVAVPLTDIDNAHQTVSFMFELDEQRQFRVGRVEVYGLDAKTASSLVWSIKAGDVYSNEKVQKFFEDNKSSFPAGSYWAKEPEMVRDLKTAMVYITYTFLPCPNQAIGVVHNDR